MKHSDASCHVNTLAATCVVSCAWLQNTNDKHFLSKYCTTIILPNFAVVLSLSIFQSSVNKKEFPTWLASWTIEKKTSLFLLHLELAPWSLVIGFSLKFSQVRNFVIWKLIFHLRNYQKWSDIPTAYLIVYLEDWSNIQIKNFFNLGFFLPSIKSTDVRLQIKISTFLKRNILFKSRPHFSGPPAFLKLTRKRWQETGNWENTGLVQ